MFRTSKKDGVENLKGTNFKLFDHDTLREFFYSFRHIDNFLFKDFISAKFGLNFERINNEEWGPLEYKSFLIDLKSNNNVWENFGFKFESTYENRIIFQHKTLQAILIFKSKKCNSYNWQIIKGKEILKKDDLFLFKKNSRSGVDYWDRADKRRKLNNYDEIIKMIKEYLENIYLHI